MGSLRTGNAEERGAPPGNDGGGTARNERFVGGFEALDGLGTEVEVVPPVVEARPDAKIPFEQGDISRKKDEDIGGKVMGLKFETPQETFEEIARRKAETTLEMGEKDYPFPFARCRRDLPGRRDAVRHP